MITYANDQLCSMTGYTHSELMGSPIADLRFDHEQRENWSTIFEEAKTGKKWAGILRNRTRTGNLIVVESSVVPILNALGAVTEIVSLDVDITQVHQNHENLVDGLQHQNYTLDEQRHFLSEYKHALEVGSCICVTDVNLIIQSINKPLEDLLGVDSEVLRGQPLTQIAPDMPEDGCLSSIEQTAQDDFTHRIVRFVGAGGKELQFSVGCVGVHSMAGQLESIILVCQDVTESLRLTKEISDTQRDLLYMLGDVVETRSAETGQHVKRVAQTSRFLALKIGLDRNTADMIEAAAPMHDVGKVGIRDAILHKPGKLTPEEYEEMKQHARIGHDLLKSLDRPLIALAGTIAQEHHERYDGRGYPGGLKGDEISMAGRIVAIADVLDALSSARIYKPAWDEQRVIDYFREQRGLQFDPDLVDLLLKHWDTIKALHKSGGHR